MPSHRIMERRSVHDADHSIVDDESDNNTNNDEDEDDEASILARVLRESQSSFILEQQYIYENIRTESDVKTESNYFNNFYSEGDRSSEGNGNKSRWRDDRRYNNTTKFTPAIQGDFVALSECASIRDFVVNENDDDEDEEVYDRVDDMYHHQSSFHERRRRRCQSDQDDHHTGNYQKMPSQSSIFTSSTCAETTTTAGSSTIPVKEERDEVEKGTNTASSSFISDDMIIQEQIRILRTIQEEQERQVLQHHHRSASTTTSLDYSADTTTTTTSCHYDYRDDFVVPYGTATVRVRGIPPNVMSSSDMTGSSPPPVLDSDPDGNVVTTQCTHCSTLSQVVPSATCQFLFCVQCQEISPIVPISRSDVIDILQQQQQQEEQQQQQM